MRESSIAASRRPVLGVLGGTFNPPHLGHVAIAGLVLGRGLVERVWVVPCHRHPLGKDAAPFAQRLAWTRAAMGSYGESVLVSDIERRMADEGHGDAVYTIDVLERLASLHPGWQVRLIVGSDIVDSPETQKWRRWSDIVARFAPIVLRRPSENEPGDGALPAVSSSEIRSWLDAQGHDVGAAAALEQWVPASVLAMMRAPAGCSVAILGRGNVATHASTWLAGRNHPVTSLSVRSVLASRQVGWTGPAPAVAWVLGRDGQLPALADALAGSGWPSDTVVLHGAGALPSHDADALGTLAARGHPVGTLHPICSLRRERHDGSRLELAAFGIEGDPDAVARARELIGHQPWLDLGGLDRRGRAAYHGACALAANHWAVLQQEAVGVLVREGLDADTAQRSIDLLMTSALENLQALGFPAGVSGPVARGDDATVRAHIEALGPGPAELYEVLSRRLRALLATMPAERGID